MIFRCSFGLIGKSPAKPAGAPAQCIGFVPYAALALCAVAVFASGVASAQDKGTLDPQPLPPLAKPATPVTPARELFARKTTPATLAASSIGFYSKGCLAGAVALPINAASVAGVVLRANSSLASVAGAAGLASGSRIASRVAWYVATILRWL